MPLHERRRRGDARRAENLFLAAAFALFSASTVAWTFLDRTPPVWDPSDHIRWAYDYYAALSRADLAGIFSGLFSERHPYPPLVHLAGALAFLALGASRLTSVLPNLVFLAGLMIAVRSAGDRLYPDALLPIGRFALRPGAAAAVVAASYHFPAWLLHDAFLDFPLTALVAIALAVLIRSENFDSRRYALAFGAAAGLGMLAKQTFAFFFILPGIDAVIHAVNAARRGNRRPLLNLLLMVGAAGAAAAVWYGPHLDDVVEIYRTNRMNADLENEAGLWTGRSLGYYWYVLLGLQMQIPLGLAFLGGAAWSIRRAAAHRVLYLSIASGILAFTIIANKDARYTVPVLPAAALLSTCWIGDRRIPARIQRGLAGLLLAFSLLTFANAQWPGAWNLVPGLLRAAPFEFDHRPLTQGWGIEDSLQVISRESSRHRPRVGVIANLPHLNPSSVAAYARLLAVPDNAGPSVEVDWLTAEAALERLESCDFLIARTDIEGAARITPGETAFLEWIAGRPDRFAPLARFPLPEGYGTVTVFRNGGEESRRSGN